MILAYNLIGYGVLVAMFASAFSFDAGAAVTSGGLMLIVINLAEIISKLTSIDARLGNQEQRPRYPMPDVRRR